MAHQENSKWHNLLAALCVWFVISPTVALGGSEDTKGASAPIKLLVPQVDSERGKRLFGSKACVVCHAINGIGGKAAPALDARASDTHIDLLDFAARMWRGADVMIVLQSMELGYQITLSGQEIADLAAFIYDAEGQKSFTMAEVPEVVRQWFLDQPIEYDPDDFKLKD